MAPRASTGTVRFAFAAVARRQPEHHHHPGDRGITTDHLATLVDAKVAPYLFTASAPTLSATTLSIALQRKTAEEIGLSTGQGALYDASLVALSANSPEAAAIANLPDQAAVIATYRQITPPSFGHAAIRAAESFSDAGFGAAYERLASLSETRSKNSGEIGMWFQEFGDFAHQSTGVEETAFTSSTLGIGAGIDKPVLGLDAIGAAILSSWTTVKQAVAPGYSDVPIQISMQGIAPYLSWSHKALFVQATALAATVTYNSTRTLSIDSFTDTVSARWHGSQFGAGLTIGAGLTFGQFHVTPSNTINWLQLRQNGYTEQGGGAFALTVDGRTDHVFSDTGRLSLRYLFPFGDGNLFGQVHGAYTHDFSASNGPTVARFITGGDAIALPQDVQQSQRYGYGGGFGYLQGSLKLMLGYDRRQNNAYHSQQVAMTASMAF